MTTEWIKKFGKFREDGKRQFTVMRTYVRDTTFDPLRRVASRGKPTHTIPSGPPGLPMQRVTYVVLLDVALRPISAAQSERRRLYLIQRLLVAVVAPARCTDHTSLLVVIAVGICGASRVARACRRHFRAISRAPMSPTSGPMRPTHTS